MNLKVAAVTPLISASMALAHGEDKPGPHGGVIRMPGAFHTELVQMGSREFKVYLLDINWKNPSVRNSSVALSFGGEKGKRLAKCEKDADAFVCKFDENFADAKGKLIVQARRENQAGAGVEYVMPLKKRR